MAIGIAMLASEKVEITSPKVHMLWRGKTVAALLKSFSDFSLSCRAIRFRPFRKFLGWRVWYNVVNINKRRDDLWTRICC